jgi:hypothetical protein
MRSLIVLSAAAGLLHYFVGVPVLLAAIGALMLWIVWKLKWVILGILGLEMLFGGGGGDSGGGNGDWV